MLLPCQRGIHLVSAASAATLALRSDTQIDPAPTIYLESAYCRLTLFPFALSHSMRRRASFPFDKVIALFVPAASPTSGGGGQNGSIQVHARLRWIAPAFYCVIVQDSPSATDDSFRTKQVSHSYVPSFAFRPSTSGASLLPYAEADSGCPLYQQAQQAQAAGFALLLRHQLSFCRVLVFTIL